MRHKHGIEVELRDTRGSSFRELFNPYRDGLAGTTADVSSRMICARAGDRFDVHLKLHSNFKRYTAQGVKIVVATGTGSGWQALWVDVPKASPAAEFVLTGPTGDGYKMPTPDPNPERATANWVKEEHPCANNGCVAVHVERGKLDPSGRDRIVAGAAARNSRITHPIEIPNTSFNELCSDNGNPYIFEFRNADTATTQDCEVSYGSAGHDAGDFYVSDSGSGAGEEDYTLSSLEEESEAEFTDSQAEQSSSEGEEEEEEDDDTDAEDQRPKKRQTKKQQTNSSQTKKQQKGKETLAEKTAAANATMARPPDQDGDDEEVYYEDFKTEKQETDSDSQPSSSTPAPAAAFPRGSGALHQPSPSKLNATKESRHRSPEPQNLSIKPEPPKQSTPRDQAIDPNVDASENDIHVAKTENPTLTATSRAKRKRSSTNVSFPGKRVRKARSSPNPSHRPH